MQKVTTDDGSVTYFNEEFQEHYHSTSGAREEALEKHVMPALKHLKEKGLIGDKIVVLDFCFGLGYNSFIFIEEIKKIDKKVEIEIIGIDNDIEIIAEGRKLFKEILDKYVYSDDNVNLKVEIDDCKEAIKDIDTKFDVCFFDPFSPKKCPELWSEEIFRDVFRKMNKNGILTTYSCASKVRENMKKAGFEVIDGPCIGRRAPSTICIRGKDG